jgi:hypothetical protein
VTNRRENPTEDWTRGSDLPDGKLSLETWLSILNKIAAYEMIDITQYIGDGYQNSKTASLLDDIPREFPNLWFENEKGDRFVPDLEHWGQSGYPGCPEGYDYQVSRFPTTLTQNHLRIIKQEDVDACDHPEKYVEADLGIIDTMDGQDCKECGGHRERMKGGEWSEWEAYGSRDVFSMNMGWSEDLALALVRQGFGLSEAIVVAATCCERCMNVLADECGLDWGYPEGSEDYEKCGTSCAFCEGKPV